MAACTCNAAVAAAASREVAAGAAAVAAAVAAAASAPDAEHLPVLLELTAAGSVDDYDAAEMRAAACGGAARFGRAR